MSTRNEEGSNAVAQAGMSLRDYFAGQALTAVHFGDAVSRYTTMQETGTEDGGSTKEQIAEYAYNMADAMLAERQKQS
jgi:hypothetical protein